MISSRWAWLPLTAALLGGCEKPPAPPPAGTGAEAVAKAFFEALVREDWAAAYDTLDAGSRVRCSKAQFAGRAKAAIRQLGFTPTEVGVTVSENGDHASAVAVYRGVSDSGPKHFKDGTALRRTDRGWAVVLRSNFGNKAATPAGKAGPGAKG